MKFETKPLSLSQRMDCNKVEMEVTPKGTIITSAAFETQLKYLRYGLKTLDGIEVTEESFDRAVMSLTNENIKKIADQVADETNFSKKKKS